jgi:lysyl-tRNA synthetase class 1
MPISPYSGKVLQVPLLEINPSKGMVVFEDENGKKVEQSILNGNAKLQWKADWAMRWKAFDVDYEMCGADLIDSLRLSSKIVKTIGGNAPENLTYALFTDEQGQKISKSKGNGISIDEWLRYANPESLSLFMYNKPTTSKRLYFDVIPRHVDEYYQHLNGFDKQTLQEQMSNPAMYIHRNKGVPTGRLPISYNLLLNLANAANTETEKDMWAYITAYNNSLTSDKNPDLNNMTGKAVNYYHDFVKPAKKYRIPTNQEKIVLADLSNSLSQFIGKQGIEKDLETFIYDIGKKHYGKENLRDFFAMFYNVLLGQENGGPRLPNFIMVYGIKKTQAMVNQAISTQNNFFAAEMNNKQQR